ncbi:MAG: MMPL family transporter, partial [Pseudomonadota bacterium]
MKKILTMTAAHPWTVLLILLLISLLAAVQLHRLQMHVSPQALTIENDPAKAFYQQTLATFGSDDITLLFIRDRDLFERGRLAAIRSTIARLEALPFVESTDSLFSLPHIRVVDDFVSTDPYLKEIPNTAGQAERLREAALKNPFIRHNLLSDDGTAMAVNLRLRRSRDAPAFDAEAAAAIEAAITPLKSEVEELFQLGLPYLRTQVRDAIQLDQKTLLPLSVLVLLVTLTLIFRGAGAALLPLLTASLSVLWTLGGMAALGIPLNVMSAIVPVLLIIIGSTEDIHLISEYQAGMIAGYGRRRAIHYMARRLGLAVLLTFATSYLGFLSIAVNPIQLLREFGLVASTGLALNFLITASLVPVYLRFCGRRCPTARKRGDSVGRERIIDRVSRLVLKRKRRIMLLTLAVCAVAAYGSLSVGVNNNLLDYFQADSPVRYRVQTLHQELAGMESFSILLDGDIEGTFQKSRYLEEIGEIQDFLRRSADFDSSLSVTDSLSLFNSAVNDTGELALPDDDEVLAELTNLIDREHIASYVSADFSQARILVRHNLGDSRELNRALESLQSFIDERTDAGLHINITGESILTSRAADRMALGQAKSLGL